MPSWGSKFIYLFSNIIILIDFQLVLILSLFEDSDADSCSLLGKPRFLENIICMCAFL